MKNKQDHFEILRKLQKNPNSSQRELAKELGFSLGKLNYCLRALQAKGQNNFLTPLNWAEVNTKNSLFSPPTMPKFSTS